MNLQPLLRAALLVAPLTLAGQSASFDVALIGDTPYGAANEPKFERMIADINRSGVQLAAHIGDTKNGSTRCDDAFYTKALNWFNTFDMPVLYSLGDNEWTDCMRANNGAFDPLARLALARKTYFPTNMSLGKNAVAVVRQSDDAQYSLYVENAMLVRGPVVFATIHVVGSNNNLEYKNTQGSPNPFYDNDAEFRARNTANIAWLRKTFALAKERNLLGIMLLLQANMFEQFFDSGTGSTRSGYADFIAALREEAKNFKGEVVLVSGDTHYMRVDKPLTDQYPACTAATGECKPFTAAEDARGARLLNFTRVEVPGSNDVHWVLCHVRPNSRNLFTFEFMIMPDAPSTGVTPVVTAPGNTITNNSLETTTSQLVLDASRSTSTNTGALTYKWSYSPGYAVPGIARGDTATPLIQLSQIGTYQLTLTVTDRTGATGNSTVTILRR
ncbi:MAG TPA: PKD domain-containing protein [Bryobacteraceae bacterium]|jgi:hypothetical protein|nr:PKD domain-containing protein [Bryobacteraceae bacterium]